MFSAILTSVTVFFSIIIYLMLRGKKLVNITAEGAGRIKSEQSRNNMQVQTEREMHASIDYNYPLYNIAGLTNF